MKKIYIIAVLAVFTATSALALSVVGSRHDMVFSGFATGAGGSTEVCIFCHTPHGAQTSVTLAPLWNNVPAANIVGIANIYNSSMRINNVSTQNFTASEAQINATDVRLCLACHDGTVGEPINQPNSGNMVISNLMMATNAVIGANLSNDHPIGMDLGLNPQTTDPGIRTLLVITGSTGFNENPFYNGAANTMWCSTCHDVHDNEFIPFLRISNVGSAMCKACHIK